MKCLLSHLWLTIRCDFLTMKRFSPSNSWHIMNRSLRPPLSPSYLWWPIKKYSNLWPMFHPKSKNTLLFLVHSLILLLLFMIPTRRNFALCNHLVPSSRNLLRLVSSPSLHNLLLAPQLSIQDPLLKDPHLQLVFMSLSTLLEWFLLALTISKLPHLATTPLIRYHF